MPSDSDPSYRWYVVHTYSGFEERVRDTLRQRAEALGLHDSFDEIVVPTETVTGVREGERIDIKRKFFPGYILVKMAMTDKAWAVVKNTPKVTGFVGTGKVPTALTDDEVHAIIYTVNPRDGRPPPATAYKVGDQVQITDGPFTGFGGTVEQIDPPRELLRVTVSIHGRMTSVELKYGAVQKAG